MGMMFGTQDHIECLGKVTLDGPNGESLCLASKVSLHFFVAGVHVSDGGYVLKIKGKDSYYPLTKEKITALQAGNVLPSPLPTYHIAWHEYLFGYSLWLILVGVLIAALLKRLFGKLRPFLLADAAPSLGPPVVRSEDDRWLAAEAEKLLEPTERVQQQAFGFDRDPSRAAVGIKSYCVLLTDRRLIFIHVAMRGLRARPENIGTVSYARSDVTEVGRSELRVMFSLGDGRRIDLWVAGSQRRFTNQWLFARDVPKILASRAAPTQVSGAQAKG